MTAQSPRKARWDSIPENKLEIIFAKCVVNGECLEWTGNYFRRPGRGKTYPYINYRGKPWRGNRLALFLSSGIMPDGMMALHHCDNTKCVNPKHLYWGDAFDNTRDAYVRGRARNAKVTHCPYGHPYSGKNLKFDTNGYKVCASCKCYRDRKTEIKSEVPERYRD